MTVDEGCQKVFKERINHVTGEREWAVAEDDYDIIQEVARSRFGDMILDYDRNDRYEAALVTVIAEKKAKGEYVHVLDIGTGTGLLSLMAARAGADQVTALEVFRPMAECARKIVAESGYADKITVIANRSTDLSHLGEKPNVIVAEVFDTELIGEGALRTFKEALENLVQPGCRVIPARAKFYVQAVESATLRRFNDLPTVGGRRPERRSELQLQLPQLRQGLVPVAEEVEVVAVSVQLIEEETPLGSGCPGNCAVQDVQLSHTRPDGTDYTTVSEDTVVFEFNFEDAHSILYDEAAIERMKITRDGTVDAFLAWWDLDMDGSGGGNTLTMAPRWADDTSRWRDHWMQAIYYPPRRVAVKAGTTVPLLAGHDEFSLWFAVEDGRGPLAALDRPYCTCDFHARLSRTMIYRMNELMEDAALAEEIGKAVSLHPSDVVVVSEGSLLGLLPALTERAERVTVVESAPWMRRILHKYIKHHKLRNVHIVAESGEVARKPSLILGEPFFLSAVLPWENLPFWYEVERIRARFAGGEAIPVMPEACSLRALPMAFVDLHKTAGRVGTVNGFNLSTFDDLSEKARSAVDQIVEDYSLWEYCGEESEGARDESADRIGTELMQLDFAQSPASSQWEKKMEVKGAMNGVAIWAEWRFGGYWMSTGRRRESHLGWSLGHKQGVFFIPPSQLHEKSIHVKTRFEGASGEVAFNFSPNPIGEEEK